MTSSLTTQHHWPAPRPRPHCRALLLCVLDTFPSSPVKNSANFLMNTCSSSVAASYNSAKLASTFITRDSCTQTHPVQRKNKWTSKRQKWSKILNPNKRHTLTWTREEKRRHDRANEKTQTNMKWHTHMETQWGASKPCVQKRKSIKGKNKNKMRVTSRQQETHCTFFPSLLRKEHLKKEIHG